MGMPAHKLFGGGGGDRIEGECLLLRGNLGLHHDVDHQIAEFLLKIRGMGTLDRIDHLVCLLKQRGPEGIGRLLAIPRTTARGAEPRNDLTKLLHCLAHRDKADTAAYLEPPTPRCRIA